MLKPDKIKIKKVYNETVAGECGTCLPLLILAAVNVNGSTGGNHE